MFSSPAASFHPSPEGGLDDLFAPGHEKACGRAHQKGADQRAHAEDPAEQPADEDEEHVHGHAGEAEPSAQLVAEHDGDEVVRSGAGCQAHIGNTLSNNMGYTFSGDVRRRFLEIINLCSVSI